jgi:hypothetical protein
LDFAGCSRFFPTMLRDLSLSLRRRPRLGAFTASFTVSGVEIRMLSLSRTGRGGGRVVGGGGGGRSLSVWGDMLLVAMMLVDYRICKRP